MFEYEKAVYWSVMSLMPVSEGTCAVFWMNEVSGWLSWLTVIGLSLSEWFPEGRSSRILQDLDDTSVMEDGRKKLNTVFHYQVSVCVWCKLSETGFPQNLITYFFVLLCLFD